MNSLEFARQHTEQFIARRRDLHKHPEPGWLEYRTAAFAATEDFQMECPNALSSHAPVRHCRPADCRDCPDSF